MEGSEHEYEYEYSRKKKNKNRNKRRFSDEQIQSLETMFENQTRVEPRKKVEVARELGLQPRQVAIWFQNKRARYKSKLLEQEYGVLRANYNNLASRFENLKSEKQALLVQLQKLNELMHKSEVEGRILLLQPLSRPQETLLRSSPLSATISDLDLDSSSEDCIKIVPNSEVGNELEDDDFEAEVRPAAVHGGACGEDDGRVVVDDSDLRRERAGQRASVVVVPEERALVLLFLVPFRERNRRPNSAVAAEKKQDGGVRSAEQSLELQLLLAVAVECRKLG